MISARAKPNLKSCALQPSAVSSRLPGSKANSAGRHRTDDKLPITLAIAVPVKPVTPRLRRERTGSLNLFDRCSTRGDCARILAAKDTSKGRETERGDPTRIGCLLGAEQLGLEHDSEGTALVE
jgi:hypothetical protein